MIGTMIRAAMGSAHHHPNRAFKASPPSNMAERYAHISVWRESAFSSFFHKVNEIRTLSHAKPRPFLYSEELGSSL